MGVLRGPALQRMEEEGTAPGRQGLGWVAVEAKGCSRACGDGKGWRFGGGGG